MSFSAIKDITISNLRTVYNTDNPNAKTILDFYKNKQAGSMHKLSTVYYTNDADTSVYDDSRKDNSAETNARTEKGYVEPYNVTTTESGEFITDNKKSGFLKYEPQAAIEGSTNCSYFWIDDFKNWATWAINENTQYYDSPRTNAYVLCLWNGKTGFDPINLNGAYETKDEKVTLWQNEILAKLRTTIIFPGLQVDEFVHQMRGDFKDFGITPFGDRVPGMIASTYALKRNINYSINDADNFQTIKYGNPVNYDLAAKASTSTYIKKVKNLYFDAAAVKRLWDWSLEDAESELWDHTHFNENSDTGGEETMDYIATIGATVFLGPVAGVCTWFASSTNGNGNWMYKYKRGQHRMEDRAADKVFYDPNFGDTISWYQISDRYFTSYFDYGIPLQPYILRTDKMPTSDTLMFEFKSNKYKGKFQGIFLRNGKLKWQNGTSKDNQSYYTNGIQGETSLRFGFFGGIDYVNSNQDIKNNLSSSDVYQKRLGFHQMITNLDFMNLSSFGVPPIYRLPTGEIGLNVQMRIGGPTGVSGFDVEFLNKKCQKIFGNGQDKTINDHWLKSDVINTYEEAKTGINAKNAASLDSTKESQTSSVVKNDISLSFSANNVVLTTSDIVANDYVAKW